MNYQHSRKNFIAKAVSLGAAMGALPAILTTLKRPAAPHCRRTAAALRQATRIHLRPDARAVARTDSTT